jgi:hypothetical protein
MDEPRYSALLSCNSALRQRHVILSQELAASLFTRRPLRRIAPEIDPLCQRANRGEGEKRWRGGESRWKRYATVRRDANERFHNGDKNRH